jgi:hypothetical protein
MPTIETSPDASDFGLRAISLSRSGHAAYKLVHQPLRPLRVWVDA